MKRLAVILSIIAFTAAIFACSSAVRYSGGGSRVSNEKKDSPKKSNNKQTTPKSTKINTRGTTGARADLLAYAESFVGVPYCFGGEGRDCTDCSGFTLQVFEAAGIYLPRTARDQFDFSSRVERKNLLPGDLVFFREGKDITHTGIFSGDNSFIHASTSLGVTITSLDDSYFAPRFAGGGRVME